MTHAVPSVWTWTIEDIQNYLSCLHQQGLASKAAEVHEAEFHATAGAPSQHMRSVNALRIEFQDTMDSLAHSLSWAVEVRKYDPERFATHGHLDTNLTSARAKVIAVMAIAAEMRNLLWS